MRQVSKGSLATTGSARTGWVRDDTGSATNQLLDSDYEVLRRWKHYYEASYGYLKKHKDVAQEISEMKGSSKKARRPL